MLLLLLLVLAQSWNTSVPQNPKAAGANKAADILYGLR
jgi:hypothetical protein